MNQELKEKYNYFVRHHKLANTLFYVCLTGLLMALASHAMAESSESLLPFGIPASMEAIKGFLLGAPLGYAFAQKTSVKAAEDKADKLEKEVQEFNQIRNKILEEKLLDK